MIQSNLPPQALDFEEVVLGSIMLEKDAFDRISDAITTESFYRHQHQIIFSAIKSLRKKNEVIDILTVTQELKSMGKLDVVGGAYYITTLTSRIGSTANLESHAKVIQQKYIQREMIRISSDVTNRGYDESTDVYDLISETEHKLNQLKAGLNISTKTKGIREIVSNTLESIKNAEKNNGVLGPSTGLADLDKLLRGLQPPNVIVIAGRPAMGKSAIVLCIAKSLCIDQQIPVAIFSLEMSAEQLIHRLLSDLSEIDNNHLASGKLTDYEKKKLDIAQLRITENLFIDDTPSITDRYLESKVRKLVEKGVRYIIIDYVQLMTLADKDLKGKNREQEISHLTRSLKRIAKKYDICIIELSQLSRECEKREPPRPMLSDLRESGSIEMDADIVIFLYRPEYYNIEFTPSGRPSRGLAELIIAKHRNGPVDSVVVKFKGEFTRFENDNTIKTETIEDAMGEKQPTITF